jgi:hypothetical protein
MSGLIFCRGWPLPNHLIAIVTQPPQPLPRPLWDLLGRLELARHSNRYLMPLLHHLLLPLLIAGPLLPICYLDLIPAYLCRRQLPLLLLLCALLRLPLPSRRRLLRIPSLVLILETLNRIESLLLFLLQKPLPNFVLSEVGFGRPLRLNGCRLCLEVCEEGADFLVLFSDLQEHGLIAELGLRGLHDVIRLSSTSIGRVPGSLSTFIPGLVLPLPHHGLCLRIIFDFDALQPLAASYPPPVERLSHIGKLHLLARPLIYSRASNHLMPVISTYVIHFL